MYLHKTQNSLHISVNELHISLILKKPTYIAANRLLIKVKLGIKLFDAPHHTTAFLLEIGLFFQKPIGLINNSR